MFRSKTHALEQSPRNVFTKSISNTHTHLGEGLAWKFFMGATSNAFSGVPVQVFLRQLDFHDIGEQILLVLLRRHF